MKTFKPTQPTKLAYKNAPLGVHDLVMQQVRFEDNFFPHHVEVHSQEVMKKELPTQKYSPINRNWFQANIQRPLLAIMP